MLSYKKDPKSQKPAVSTLQFLAAAFALACVTLSLLLPGLALRFPALSGIRASIGATDRMITLLFAASTPVVIASRFNTVLVRIFAARAAPRFTQCTNVL